jgi:hypothetical protein
MTIRQASKLTIVQARNRTIGQAKKEVRLSEDDRKHLPSVQGTLKGQRAKETRNEVRALCSKGGFRKRGEWPKAPQLP